MHIFNLLNTYRFDVYLLYGMVMWTHWAYLPLETTLFDPRIIVGVVFGFALVSVYLFNKTCDTVEDSISQPEERLSNSIEVRVKRILSVLAVFPVVLLLYYKLPLWPYLFSLGIGFLYSYPFYKGKRLKNFLLIKNIVAGAGIFLPLYFGMFVYFVPFYTSSYTPDISSLIAVTLMYIAGELLWDIRDTNGDRASGVRTMPVVFGILATKLLASILVTVSLLLISKTLPNAIFGLILFVFIYLASPTSPRHYYHALLYLMALFIGITMVWM